MNRQLARLRKLLERGGLSRLYDRFRLQGLRVLYRFAYVIPAKLLFRSFDGSSYVSPLASVRNHRSISVGRRCQIERDVTLWVEDLILRDRVSVGPGTRIFGTVTIGKNVMIAPNVVLAGGNHGIRLGSVPMFEQECSSTGIVIEDDVWIGANAIIVDGVKVSTGAVIGAGAVVTRDVSPYSIVAGNPAEHLKCRE